MSTHKVIKVVLGARNDVRSRNRYLPAIILSRSFGTFEAQASASIQAAFLV